MTAPAEQLADLKRVVLELTEDQQLRVRLAHRHLLSIVRAYGECGPVALALLAADVMVQMGKDEAADA